MEQRSKGVSSFARGCEHLLAHIALHHPLNKEEKLLVEHYCKEVLEKLSSPPPAHPHHRHRHSHSIR
jgi:hypothetical protein